MGTKNEQRICPSAAHFSSIYFFFGNTHTRRIHSLSLRRSSLLPESAKSRCPDDAINLWLSSGSFSSVCIKVISLIAAVFRVCLRFSISSTPHTISTHTRVTRMRHAWRASSKYSANRVYVNKCYVFRPILSAPCFAFCGRHSNQPISSTETEKLFLQKFTNSNLAWFSIVARTQSRPCIRCH